MRFENGKTYKHRKTLDMHIYVAAVVFETAKNVKLKVYYVDERGMLFHGNLEEVIINDSEYPNWKLVNL